jgi:hypothetical protein
VPTDIAAGINTWIKGEGMKKIWIGLALSMALSACGTQIPNTQDQAVVLNDHTKVLGTAPARGSRIGGTVQNIADLSWASADLATIVFNASPYSLGLQVGDIISAPPNQVTGSGYLRKVTSVANYYSAVIVGTEESDLDEAIAYADSEQAVDLEQTDIVSVTYADGSSLNAQQLSTRAQSRATATLGKVNVPFDNIGICTGVGGEKITAKGAFSASLKAFLRVHFHWFSLREASAGIQANESFNLQLSGKCNYSLFNVETPVATINFGTKVIWIGPIPVVITPYISLKVGANGNVTLSGSFNITQTFSGTYGIMYKKGQGFSPINDSTFSVTGLDTISANANLSLTGYVKAETGFKFYGIAYLYATPKPYLEINGTYSLPANAFTYSLYAGVKVSVGGRLRIFGKTLGEFNSPEYDVVRKLIAGNAAGSTTPNTGPPTPTPTPTPNPNPNPRPCATCAIP